jgi:hypothetical protein
MKVIQELAAYFDRRGRLGPQQLERLLEQGLEQGQDQGQDQDKLDSERSSSLSLSQDCRRLLLTSLIEQIDDEL